MTIQKLKSFFISRVIRNLILFVKERRLLAILAEKIFFYIPWLRRRLSLFFIHNDLYMSHNLSSSYQSELGKNASTIYQKLNKNKNKRCNN